MLESKCSTSLSINNTFPLINIKYNIDTKNVIKDFLNYIIRKHVVQVSPEYLNFIENVMHFEDCKNVYFVNYSLSRLSNLI